MTGVEHEVLHWLRIAPATIDDLRLMISDAGGSRRVIEEAVESLRLAGEPIIGGNDGLRLTENPDELAKYLEARRRRAAQIHRGTMRLRSTLRRMRHGSQETLFGDAA